MVLGDQDDKTELHHIWCNEVGPIKALIELFTAPCQGLGHPDAVENYATGHVANLPSGLYRSRIGSSVLQIVPRRYDITRHHP